LSSVSSHSLAIYLFQLECYKPDIKKIVPSQFFEHFKTTIREYELQHNPTVLYNLPAPPLPIRSTPIKSETARIVHEPRHDVESMFWVLCIALGRANPRRDATHSQEPSSAYNSFCRHMLLEDDPKNLRKNRGLYLHEAEGGWQEILHPDLADAASLLHYMGAYLAIRTRDAKRESWGPYHAHDMFRVLLLATIEKFRDNPVLLCTHAPRVTTSLATTRVGTPTIGTSESRVNTEVSSPYSYDGYEALSHHSGGYEITSHHSGGYEITSHRSDDYEATSHHHVDHEIVSHHSHGYNTRTKHSVESGRSISAKRAREIESSEESNNDRPDDADFVPVGRQAKKRKIEKGKQPAKPHKGIVPEFPITYLDGLAINQREGFMNRETWFFLGGKGPSCDCAMLEGEGVSA
jgi:hypothetical protein